jgi:hypothetical protein
MWGAYLNGFLCGLFAFIYLKCGFANRRDFDMKSSPPDDVQRRYQPFVQRQRRVHRPDPALRFPHRYQRGLHHRQRHRCGCFDHIRRAGRRPNVREA